MKKYITFFFPLIFVLTEIYSQSVVKQQVVLEGNNIRSYIWNTGVFNQDLRTNNTPGFEWPKGSGKFACFTAGLTISAIVNGQLRMGTASYNGEYCPGFSENGVYQTDTRFRHYKVRRGDNYINNPSWLNWGLMVPFGAPFTDMNNNGTYEYFVDIPGYKGATETVFICLTDGNPANHTPSEGFGGGTAPLFATVGLTAWCFDTLEYKDVQFFKWNIINGSSQTWDTTLFSIVTDPDLGDATDDYIGCDTARNLGYVFNYGNDDGSGKGNSYGLNPPAWGISFLNCHQSNVKINSFVYFTGSGSPGPVCERDPSNAAESRNYVEGIKKDGTPWVNILNNQITKYCYSGDPETNTGWTQYQGRIENCNGQLTGNTTIPVPPGDRRFVMNYIPAVHSIAPGSSVTFMAAQMVARGNSNKNSVTLLKQLADSVKGLCQNNFVIGIQPVSNVIPSKYILYQNYPNPFNPVTKIRFDLPKALDVKISVYDILGHEVDMLLNMRLPAGEYEADWDGSAFATGVYFCRMEAQDYSAVIKMVLIK